MLSQNEERVWCYSCDCPTDHEVRYMSQSDFVGKILVYSAVKESRNQWVATVVSDERPSLDVAA